MDKEVIDLSKGPRVVVYYDPAVDKEIAKVIEETPKRRQSGVLRELMLIGLMVKKNGLMLQTPSNQPPSVPDTQVTEEVAPIETTKVRKRLNFRPPE